MSEPTLYRTDYDDIDPRLPVVLDLVEQGVLVPVELDYEAFDEAIRQLTEHTTESIANVLEGTATIDDMRQESAVPWRNRLLDALGIGGDDAEGGLPCGHEPHSQPRRSHG